MNIERIEKLIEIDGKLQKIIFEIDEKENEIIRKHVENVQKMRKIGFNNSGQSTLGKGKKTGNMAKSTQSRNYKNNKTRVGSRTANARKINENGVNSYYSLDLPQF